MKLISDCTDFQYIFGILTRLWLESPEFGDLLEDFLCFSISVFIFNVLIDIVVILPLVPFIVV